MNEFLLFCRNNEYGFPHWDGFDAFHWYIIPTSWTYMIGVTMSEAGEIPPDIINSIHAPVGSPTRKYSEYGRHIIQKKQTIMEMLGDL